LRKTLGRGRIQSELDQAHVPFINAVAMAALARESYLALADPSSSEAKRSGRGVKRFSYLSVSILSRSADAYFYVGGG
jgi:hypothetical protein